MCCEQAFMERLRAQGLRLTPQREAVLSVLHDLEGHNTVEEIHARVQMVSPSVDLVTVYRTLELLEELHMAASVDLGDGQRRYELLGLHGTHHHLLCRACGRLITLDDEAIQPWVSALAHSYGFDAEPEHLVVRGLCAQCRQLSPQSQPESAAVQPQPA